MATNWPIVFMGTPQTAADTLEYLLAKDYRIAGVVTQPDRPAGRGQKSVSSPVRQLAQARAIPSIAPQKIRAPEVLEKLTAWQPAAIVVVAFGRILPKPILELAPHGCINVHYSLLPKYRGAAPAAWTIIQGERDGGVTTMKLVEKMDAGPIYLQQAVELAPDETNGSLQRRLTPIGARLLADTLEGLKNGDLAPREQDESLVSFAPLLKKEDGLIDWTMPAEIIERRVRGLSPWPGAFTYIGSKLLKLHRVRLYTVTEMAEPGEVIRADAGGFCVAAGSGALELQEVLVENKNRVPGVEFVKGARIKAGDRLGSQD
jgi:methionyl-tRNA formyltransferase